MNETQMQLLRECVAAGAKATKGEWECAREYDGGRSIVAVMRSPDEHWSVNAKRGYDGPNPAVNTVRNGNFIAAAANAREALTALLAEYEAMQAELARLRESATAAVAHIRDAARDFGMCAKQSDEHLHARRRLLMEFADNLDAALQNPKEPTNGK